MSQYTTGTASVTNASDKVYITGDGVDLAANVSIGQAWKRKDENALYQILDVDSDVDGEFIRIAPTYQGTTAVGVGYQITRDYTPNKSFVEINAGDVDWPYHLTQGVIRKLDTLLADTETDYRKLPLFYSGMPEQDREFGQIQLAAPVEIAEIGICAESPPEADISLDIAIAGVYQGLSGLTLPASSFSFYKTVALNASAGDVVNMKFTSVPAGIFPGSNYTIWIKFKNTSVMEMRYDCNVFSPGMAEAGKRIGRGFKPPVKSRYFAGMIRTQSGVPLGADLKIALMHNDAQQSQTLTLTAGAVSQYTSFAQKDVLTTETIDTIITQPGSDFPGSDITVILYSYKIS